MSLARAIAPALLAVVPLGRRPSKGWANARTIPFVYLRDEVAPPVLSNPDSVPDDPGSAGAKVALADTQTTGPFLGHSYSLTVPAIPPAAIFGLRHRQRAPQAPS